MDSFSNRVWWTKKARIKAERRLLSLDFYSQLFLMWYSIFLVCYSIYTLTLPPENKSEPAVMVGLSVLVLVVTLFVNNMNFRGRAMLMKQCYEQLSIIYTRSKSEVDFSALDRDYQSVLSISENHSEKDYYKALVDEYNNASDKNILTKKPTCLNFSLVYFLLFKNFVFFISLLSFPFLIVFVLRGM